MDLKATLGLDAAPETENTVHYELYRDDEGTLPADLEALRVQLTQHVLQHISGYIWQRDRFQLRGSDQQGRQSEAVGTAGQGGGSATPRGLWGSVCFGENLEDEWFIVWLLMDITRQFPGVTARVWDNDGEFLLIEAAYALPRWLKPGTAANRVWLRAGVLHLVPLPSTTHPTLPPSPTAAEALHIVRAEGVATAASGRLQALVRDRISGYPGAAADAAHRARAVLPLRLAALLRQEPQLVAPAIEAFHYRDIDDMKAAGRMQHFPPAEMVTSSVAFSRCLYAQLAQQSFQSPAGYPLPPPGSPAAAAAELGMKLTVGMEMMYCARSRFGSAPEHGTRYTGDLSANPAWEAYQGSLQRSGYFGANIAGSAAHRQLLAAAQASFRASEAYERSTSELAAPARRIDALLQLPASAEEFVEVGSEDDSAWLAEGAVELEAQLAARQAELDAAQQRSGTRRSTPAAEDAGEEEDFDAALMAKQMQAFVGTMSSYEGAEVPGGSEGPLDAGRFWAELSSSLGIGPGDTQQVGKGGSSGEEGGSESSSESDGFYSEQDDEGVEPLDAGGEGAPHEGTAATRSEAAGSRQVPHRSLQGSASQTARRVSGSQQQEAWEAATATDSDDEAAVSDEEDDAGFMAEYDRAMREQLAGSRLAESFQRVPAAERQAAEGEAGDDSIEAEEQERGSVGVDAECGAGNDSMRPVDVDLNLVSSLLESFSSQQGMPGPASNLAGMLGLRLPHDSKRA